jgi:O-antigen ligase
VALVASFFLRNKTTIKGFAFRFWDVLLYLLVLVVGLVYTSDLERGLRLLETRFSMLAIPLIFWQASQLREEDMFKVAKWFSWGLTLACFICVGNATIRYVSGGDPSVFLFENLTGVIAAQPTYFAYYIIFSITFGLYTSYYHPDDGQRTPTLAMVLFLFVILMLTGGKTAFISLLLTFAFFVLKFILEDKITHKRTVFTAVCGMLVTLFIVNAVEDWSFEGDYWERMVLWESAIRANPNPAIGVGTGDFSQVLNEYYRAHGLTQFAAGYYNAHNQFIQAYLTHGIFGLSLFLVLMARPIYFGAKNHDTLTILIFFPFLIYGMTEVFLGRYQGVILFTLIQAMSTVLARRDPEQMLYSHA